MNGKRPAEEGGVAKRRTKAKRTSTSERTRALDTETTEPPVVESEVANPQVNNLKCVLPGESSEDDLQNLSDFHVGNSNDGSDNALLGDTSEENSTSPTSNSDVDPGLPRNDYLDFEKCVLCQTERKDISYPYCTTCFTSRKNLFPSRPKRRKRSSKLAEIKSKQKAENEKTSQVLSQTSENVNSESQSASSSVSEALLADSGIGNLEPQLSEDAVDGPLEHSTSNSQSATDSSSTNDIGACRVCFLRPENGLFVHLTSAHLYGCYKCAKEIWYHTSSCPMCRRKVFKVSKLYF